MKRSFYERYIHSTIKKPTNISKKRIKINIDVGGLVEIIWNIILTILLSVGATVVLNIVFKLVAK